MLWCVAVVCCSVLWRDFGESPPGDSPLCCSDMLQCVAVCCSVAFENLHQEMRQCVAVCCSAVLQCVAVLQSDS